MTPGNPRRQPRHLTLPGVLLLLGALAGCGDESKQAALVKKLEARVAALETALTAARAPAVAPRLGNIMGMAQLRHSKLWFAGEQENWPLAAYELHELEEDFEEVEKFHPTHGNAGVPLGQLAAQLPKPAMLALQQAIHSGNRAQFSAGFDALTLSCNACHSAASVAFNVIQRPSTYLLSNQDFARQRPADVSAALPQPVSQRAKAR